MEGRFGRVAGLLCFFMTAMTFCHVQASEASVDDGRPRDANASEGDTVTFKCDLRNIEGYTIRWSWYQQDMGRNLTTNRSVNPGLPTSLEDRLSIIGDVYEEDFTIQIENVKETDAGIYVCQYALGKRHPKEAGEAVLTVWVPVEPHSPRCKVKRVGSLRSNEALTVGDSVHFSCYTSGGRPRPNVTFTKGGARVAGPALSINRHLYQLQEEDNGVTLTCTMTTPASDGPRSCSVMPLMILPVVTINLLVPRSREGSDVRFVCNGEGVPRISSYRWKVINADTGKTLTCNKYTVSDDGSTLAMRVLENIVLYCNASVPSGLSGSSSVRIDVASVEFEETTQRLEEMATTEINSIIPGWPGSQPGQLPLLPGGPTRSGKVANTVIYGSLKGTPPGETTKSKLKSGFMVGIVVATVLFIVVFWRCCNAASKQLDKKKVEFFGYHNKRGASRVHWIV